jgi:hypothetical protein
MGNDARRKRAEHRYLFMTEVEKELRNFGERVNKKARDILKQKDKNTSGALSKSLDFEVKQMPNSIRFALLWEDYGYYIDQGVKGVGGTKADGTKWKLKKVFGTNNKYKDKRPPKDAFNGWTIRRGIAPRDAKGRFQKRNSLLYAIANSVYHTGLETTHFMTKPFTEEFPSLSAKVTEAYGLDLENTLKLILK